MSSRGQVQVLLLFTTPQAETETVTYTPLEAAAENRAENDRPPEPCHRRRQRQTLEPELTGRGRGENSTPNATAQPSSPLSRSWSRPNTDRPTDRFPSTLLATHSTTFALRPTKGGREECSARRRGQRWGPHRGRQRGCGHARGRVRVARRGARRLWIAHVSRVHSWRNTL